MGFFNGLDIALSIFLLLGLIHGILRGFVWQVVRLVGLVAGILVARAFAQPFGDFIQTHVRDLGGSINHVVAWSLLFLVTVVIFSLLSRVVKGLVGKAELSGFDRLLGAGFGLVKAGVYSFLILVLLQGWIILDGGDLAEAPDPEPGSLQARFQDECRTSRIVPVYDRFALLIKPILPPSFVEKWTALVDWTEDQGRSIGDGSSPIAPKSDRSER